MADGTVPVKSVQRNSRCTRRLSGGRAGGIVRIGGRMASPGALSLFGPIEPMTGYRFEDDLPETVLEKATK